ncbi:sulfite exporter TauE/SafE family protein [Quadrisphaera sp. GCM10027208]|uniref:sulfite exporter TauE/SafE family protein n=1 Tax=Quadrisphaera sp. GCM10027208 TaxID=3273423 RepID=UPI0036129BA6
MGWAEAVAIFLAGTAAGTINTIVGSGTLVTFPTLLAFGYPPVVANISNNIGLVPGGVSGTWGYRRELAGQGRRLRLLAPMSFLGSVTGAVLLLILPAEAFARIVPVLLAVSLVLVVLQPRIQASLQLRRAARGHTRESRGHTALAAGGTYLAGIYGGYFGAAQGVLLVGLLGSLLPEPLQRVNAAKNLLSLVVNSVAAVVFVVVAFDRVDWAVVGLIATGSLLGGLIGAGVGRRLPARVLRAVIVVVGTVAIWRILVS